MLVIGFVAAIFVLILLNVLTRAINRPLMWVDELSIYMMVMTCFVGTSLTVHPVAGLCDIAREHGARLVIINAEPTPYDEVADAVLRDPVETVLPELVQRAVSTA